MSILNRRTELYEFRLGTARYRYTNARGVVVYNSQSYEPSALKRGKISSSSDPSHDTLSITAPLTLPLLELFRPLAPIATIGVDVYRQTGSTTTRIWTGGVGSIEFTGKKATIQCLAGLAATAGMGLKRKWQKTCPLALYSAGLGQCNASISAAKETATITVVAGSVVKAATFAGHADGWWSGGYMEWFDGAITQRRFITDHTGDAVTLMTPAAPLVAATDVTVLPGCDHTLATCDSKFDNAINFGGQPWIPDGPNPMAGQEVY